MAGAQHQMSTCVERAGKRTGEAGASATSDEAPVPWHATKGTGPTLLERMLARDNMQRAWKRVKANKGSAGVDGLDIAQTAQHLKTVWPAIREQLLNRRYRPAPVRRHSIPKPGGGERELGIPTVTDRLIQQALLQVLQPLLDPSFSPHSYGFRPGRSAKGAILAAQRHLQAGYQVVVDVDLSKFFDRVNHDILMSRVRARIEDGSVHWLIRAYLNAGILIDGLVTARTEGTPQGGPLSPLLANLLLDEVDRALERKGHRFVRYADDCNIYVRSRNAGERVMRGLRKHYAHLRLQINEDKSAVASAFGRKFLGYTFWVARGGEVRRAVSKPALIKFKRQVRTLTRRNSGRSIADVVRQVRRYLLGWKGYFGGAQTAGIKSQMDQWLRRRLRALHLKHWRKGVTMFRVLRALGASVYVAQKVAANSRRWWRNSAGLVNSVLDISYFDRLGVPRLS
jgi:RNA-directed DNA polymerase